MIELRIVISEEEKTIQVQRTPVWDNKVTTAEFELLQRFRRALSEEFAAFSEGQKPLTKVHRKLQINVCGQLLPVGGTPSPQEAGEDGGIPAAGPEAGAPAGGNAS